MKRTKPIPPDTHIYSKASLNQKLIDVRYATRGLTFGRLGDICKQYGVKYEFLPTCIKFSAPKTRLQYFIEKLHFAKVIYSHTPYSE